MGKNTPTHHMPHSACRLVFPYIPPTTYHIPLKAVSLRRTRILSYYIGSPRPQERLGVRAQYHKGEKAWSYRILMHVCF